MNKLTLVLAGLSMLGAFSIDTYFPSFPAIAEHFGVTLADMQKTLSFYLLALAVMSLFHGALSDSFGRRNIILVTLSIYTLACLGSVFAPNFTWLIFFRVLQGLTAGAGFIITQAVARDLYKGHEAQKLMAKIMMLFSLAPAIAPILGGYLHVWFGWHGVFVFLTLLGGSILAMAYYHLPDTLPKEDRQHFHPVNLSANYLKVLSNLQFGLFGLSSALCFGALAVYVTAAPDFVLNILHLEATQFGWMFIPIVTGLVTGSFLSHRMAGKIASNKIIIGAFSIMFFAATLNVTYNLFFDVKIPWAVLPLGIYVLGSSMASPSIALKALDIFPFNRGMASSVMSCMTMMIFAGVSAFIAPRVLGSGLALACVMAVMLILNLTCYYFASHRQKKIEII